MGKVWKQQKNLTMDWNWIIEGFKCYIKYVVFILKVMEVFDVIKCMVQKNKVIIIKL